MIYATDVTAITVIRGEKWDETSQTNIRRGSEGSEPRCMNTYYPLCQLNLIYAAAVINRNAVFHYFINARPSFPIIFHAHDLVIGVISVNRLTG